MSFSLPKPPRALCDKVLALLADGPASTSQMARKLRTSERELAPAIYELCENERAIMVARGGVVFLARSYLGPSRTELCVIDGGRTGPRPPMKARRLFGPPPSPLDDLESLLDGDGNAA